MIGNFIPRVWAVFLICAGSVLPAAGQAQDVVPGDNVQVTTSSELGPNDVIRVDLIVDRDTSTSTCPTPGTISAVYEPARHGFTLPIPSDMCTGQYRISATRVSSGGGSDAGTELPNLVRTPRVINVQPVVTSLDPKVLYQDDGRTLTFLGPQSLKYKGDNSSFNNYEIVFDDHALAKCEKDPGDNCYTLSTDSQNGQIKFTIGNAFLKTLSGKQSVSLLHNGAKSQAQAFTMVTAGRNTPLNYALGVTVGLVVLVYLLLSAGRRGLRVSKRKFLLSALFLDEETNTYSLSKCQFYAWTVAAILGYVFLAVSKTVVQGSPVFPDVPSGLPGILLASAGTAVLATGITSSKGSKGAGQVDPSLADFIMNGGVVAPERLQFVVWTGVGIVTFLTIVFKSDPLTVNDLPTIPTGFLQLMGISSAGYLGGKLARKPGPVIKVISVAKVVDATPAPDLQDPVITLHLQGENLDPKGSVKVDGQALRGDLFRITGTPDPQTGFCSDLNVTLNNAAAYVKDSHTLTLVNSDSQSADVVFPADPMKIESVSDRDANGKATVKGENFAAPTKYQWLNAQGKPLDPAKPTAENEATVQNTSLLTVDRPAEIGTGCKLTLISPVRLRAEKTI
jgi:hypothetical protein